MGLIFIRRFSAASCAVIDQVRNVLIWAYSLAGSVSARNSRIYAVSLLYRLVGWESFQWLELAGFTLVLLGNAVYYELLSPKRKQDKLEDDSKPLIDEGLRNGIN